MTDTLPRHSQKDRTERTELFPIFVPDDLKQTNLKMNRHYLLLSTILCGGMVMAQSRPGTAYMPQTLESSVQNDRLSGNGARDGGDIIFNEDFANGLAGNNGVGAWTVSGPNGNVWKRSVFGPRGAYTSTTQRISSATVANGYMLFCGDSANANMTANPPVMTSATSLDGALVSPVLDLSGGSLNLTLFYTQRLRWCCQTTSPHRVEVSTDGGTTWPYSFASATGISTNEDPGTEIRQINLRAAISANAANVRIRFQHNPLASHYHWQIDDVQIVEMYNNELDLLDAYLSHTHTGEEYARIPANQISTIRTGGTVTNRGINDQQNTTLAVDFNSGEMTTSINAGEILSLDTMPVEEDFTPTTLALGVYTAEFSLSSDNTDDVPANNTRSRWYEVSENRYALDGLTNPPSPDASDYSYIGTSSFDGDEDGIVVATYYQLSAPLHIYGIEMAIVGPGMGFNSTSAAGGAVAAMVIDSSNIYTSVYTPPAPLSGFSTDLFDVTADDVNNGYIQFAFGGEAGLELPAGGYFAGVELYSNAGASNILVLDDITVPQPATASMIWSPTGDDTGPRWWANGNAIAVRLLTQPLNVGIREHSDRIGVKLFPNPTEGAFSLTLDKPGVYTVEVMNMMGARVLNTRTMGERTDLDLSGYAAGVYSVRISDGTTSTVKRVTVK